MKKNFLLSVVGIFTFAVILSACQPQSTETPATETQMEQTGSPAGSDPARSEMVKDEMMEGEGESMNDELTMGEQQVTTVADYQSPAGPETVGFTIMVDEEGVITNATTDVLATAPISKTRQETFAKELPAAIKGKKLADLTKIDRLGGSSLTTNAFNSALEELKGQL